MHLVCIFNIFIAELLDVYGRVTCAHSLSSRRIWKIINFLISLLTVTCAKKYTKFCRHTVCNVSPIYTDGFKYTTENGENAPNCFKLFKFSNISLYVSHNIYIVSRQAHITNLLENFLVSLIYGVYGTMVVYGVCVYELLIWIFTRSVRRRTKV